MNTEQQVEHLVKQGFQHPEELLLTFLAGSHQHGAKLPGLDDIDVMGLYIEHPLKVLGVDTESHFSAGTQDQYVKNKPGDMDFKVYTLKRWAGLACKGNPTILGFMFTPPNLEENVWTDIILPNKNVFKASSHASAFLGYASGQIARLDGKKGKGKHGQRPELEAKFGYDVKAGMHMMRMMFECEEFLNTGNITYPNPQKDILLEIRTGKWSWEKLFKEYYEAEKRVKEAEVKSPLPKQVDRVRVSELITIAYLYHWSSRQTLDSYWDFPGETGFVGIL